MEECVHSCRGFALWSELTRLVSWPSFFLLLISSKGCARAHPPGVAPEALEGWGTPLRALILKKGVTYDGNPKHVHDF